MEFGDRESKRNRDKEIEIESRKGGSEKKYKTTIATINSLKSGGGTYPQNT